MKRALKKILNHFRYPYIHTHKGLIEGRSFRFHINNPVERFRLQSFGGEKKQIESLLRILREDDVLYDIRASVGAWFIPFRQ